MGLKINSKKTQLLCVSSAVNCNQRSYLVTEEKEKIESQKTLKILGYHFGTKPNVDAQVENLKKKFRARSWAIRHLKRAGIENEDLVKLYKALVRPVLDYAVPAYSTMLNGKQSESIEKLQRNVLKCIYGFEVSYRDALEQSGLPSLEARRRELVDKFALKLKDNDEFSNVWLPKDCLLYTSDAADE